MSRAEIAIVGAAAALDLVLYELAAWVLAALLIVGVCCAVSAGAWLHTWSDRNAR